MTICFELPKQYFVIFQFLCNLLFLLCSILFIHFGIILTRIHETCEFEATYLKMERLDDLHTSSAILVTLYGVTLAIYAFFSFLINATCG